MFEHRPLYNFWHITWEELKELSHCGNTTSSTFTSSCEQSIETRTSRVDAARSLLPAISNSDLRDKKKQQNQTQNIQKPPPSC